MRSIAFLVTGIVVGVLVGSAATLAQYPYQGQPIVAAQLTQYNDAPTVQDLYKTMQEVLQEVRDPKNPANTLHTKVDFIITAMTEQPGAGPTAMAADPLTTGGRKCISCHKEGSRRDNGGFLIWDRNGQPFNLSRSSAKNIVAHLTGEKEPAMPPPGSPQLTPAEKKAWVDHFSQVNR